MKMPLAPRSDVFQPDIVYTFGDSPQYQANQKITATIVGLVALLLPFVLLFWPWKDACFRDSISHYYYAQSSGAVLVASLAFIGTFLFAYRGEHPRESWYAFFAGLGALGVALFPTTGNGCEEALNMASRIFVDLTRDNVTEPLRIATPDTAIMFQLFPRTDWFHYASAAVLFSFLGWYCFRVFPRTIESRHYLQIENPPPNGKSRRMKPQKMARNSIYYFSGIVIVVASGAMAIRSVFAMSGNDPVWWNAGNWTFWCEAFALWAFGLSWFVKGRGFGKLKFLDD